MDPTTVATTAVTVLAPYIVKAGENSGETWGNATGRCRKSMDRDYRQIQG